MAEKKIAIGFSGGNEGGLHEDREPWIIPEEAFSEMKNMYAWRGRVKKRLAPESIGRGVSSAKYVYPAAVNSVDVSFTAPNSPDLLPVKPGSVSIVLASLTYTDPAGDGILTGGGSGTGTIDYLSGIFTINFSAPGTNGNSVFFRYLMHPSIPAMGIVRYERPRINEEISLFFDTVNVNEFIGTGKGLSDAGFYIDSGEKVVFSGSDTDFFSGANYEQALFTTNGIQGVHTASITALVPGNPDTAITLNNNISEPGDLIYIDDIDGTAGSDASKGINGKTFPVKTSTGSVITIDADTSSLLYASRGFIIVNTRNGPSSPISSVSAIQSDVPASGETRITFATPHSFSAGNFIFIKSIAGTIGDVLNRGSFEIKAVAAASADISVNTAGLAYTSGGSAYTQEGNGCKLYFEGSKTGFVNFSPMVSASSSSAEAVILKGTKQFLSYKNFVLAAAPLEGSPYTGSFLSLPQRIRFSQIGTPFYTSPSPDSKTHDGKAWRSDIPGRGGFIDLPSSQKITRIDYIRDSVVVFCERSIWELQETGIGTIPFIFKRINSELGVESPFSTVPFDEKIIGIGQRGIIAASTNEAVRIDENIPYKVFDFLNADGVKRVCAGRDYYNELVFWAWNDAASTVSSVFPNRLLVYNYRDDAFSEFNDRYTCFGHFQYFSDLIWNEWDEIWLESTKIWGGRGGQSQIPELAAGNHAGYFFVLNKSGGDPPSLSISGITNQNQAEVSVVSEHCLETGFTAEFSSVPGMTEINGLSSRIEVLTPKTFRCIDIDSSLFPPYAGGGELSVRTSLNLLTKRFSPFLEEGIGCSLKKISIFHDFSLKGRIRVSIYSYQNPGTDPGNASWQTSFSLGANPLSTIQDKLWSNFFCRVRGDFIRIRLDQDPETMISSEGAISDFILHALVLFVQSGGRTGNF
jgi:hypothetical protein